MRGCCPGTSDQQCHRVTSEHSRGLSWFPQQEDEDEVPPKMGGGDPLKEVCLEGLKTRTWP